MESFLRNWEEMAAVAVIIGLVLAYARAEIRRVRKQEKDKNEET